MKSEVPVTIIRVGSKQTQKFRVPGNLSELILSIAMQSNLTNKKLMQKYMK